MSSVLDLADARTSAPSPAARGGAGEEPAVHEPIRDALTRPLRDLRISVTDRCNFRCVYCMPKEIFGRDFVFMHGDQLLSFDEIERFSRIAVDLGVEKLRLTGGEPLLRKGIVELVERLRRLRTPDGREIDIALTTNGSALAHLAPALKEAGLDRITVSLDSLDDDVFQAMNGVNFPVGKVLDGIRAAADVGLGPIKINMVVKRGLNDGDIVSMARYFKGSGYILRFIEFMDVGSTNGWKLDEVVTSDEVVRRIDEEMPLMAVPPNYPGETASRYLYKDGEGEIGVISSVSHAFCGSCSRVRLSADGKLYTCLFATRGHDFKEFMRQEGGCTDEQLSDKLRGIWKVRGDRYSELRSAKTAIRRTGRSGRSGERRIEMSYIGG